MKNIIFDFFTEAGDGEYVNKQYYYDPAGNLMVRHNEFIKMQHGYDLRYERVDSFDCETDLDSLSRDLVLAENELNTALQDINRIKKMFVDQSEDVDLVAGHVARQLKENDFNSKGE